MPAFQGALMKITSKMLTISPYVSVAWKEISSLHTKMDDFSQPIALVITLKNLTQVEVPHLDSMALDEIFHAFARHNEQDKPEENKPPENPLQFSLPLKQITPGIPVHAATAHNPQQANFPILPPEVLEKVTQIAKIFGLEDTSLLPKAEPHCNCVHCQIVRSIHGDAPESPHAEEVISVEDLTFRGWDIKQTSDKLYVVANPLDANEQYTVFLGEPLGCTCGHKNCEHIKAVLST
ncbi:MAG TPA: hypothetical protein DCE71_04110 [Parachlamydiales bacterium]|nr:hypothetical protein [Parachlamydiales bacterium]